MVSERNKKSSDYNRSVRGFTLRKVPDREKNMTMTLNDKQIKEFRAIHRKVFGKSINRQQAMVDGLALIRLVSNIQPMKKGSVNEK